jgi:hypothetical protein
MLQAFAEQEDLLPANMLSHLTFSLPQLRAGMRSSRLRTGSDPFQRYREEPHNFQSNHTKLKSRLRATSIKPQSITPTLGEPAGISESASLKNPQLCHSSRDWEVSEDIAKGCAYDVLTMCCTAWWNGVRTLLHLDCMSIVPRPCPLLEMLYSHMGS